MFTSKKGFTLAEVLITLGIIGVVAAMTIPTLISNTNGAKFRSQFKKTLSTLNQAAKMSQAQYDFDFAGAGTCGTDPAKDNPANIQSICALFNGTLVGAKYYDTDSYTLNGDRYVFESIAIPRDWKEYYVYALADGAIVGFAGETKGCTLPPGKQVNQAILNGYDEDGVHLLGCDGFIDVNGAGLPNKEVTCSEGTTLLAPEAPCVVKNNPNNMTDIFPIVFHDGTVEPASNAARYVLTTAK